jgi:hypothetical protein
MAAVVTAAAMAVAGMVADTIEIFSATVETEFAGC